MSLTDAQLEVLFRPLNAQRVANLKGMSYLEEWDVEAHLTRIFGFEGWDKEIEYLLAFEEPVEWTAKDGSHKEGWNIGYSAKCRLLLRDPEGNMVSVREDAAAGDAVHQPSRGDAHHLALTSAVSTALKRAAKSLGNQFGLSLYDKGSLRSVVGSSLAYGPLSQEPQSDAGTPFSAPQQYEEVNGEQIPLTPAMETTRSGPPSDLPTPKQLNSAKALLKGAGMETDEQQKAWFDINIMGTWPGSISNINKVQCSRIIDLMKPS